MPSKKVLEQKQEAVTVLAQKLKEAHTGVVVDYKGITVADDTKLRKDLRESGSYYAVVKNTLLRFALKEAGIDGLDSVLEGTTAVAVNSEDYTAPAKILDGFAEKNKTFSVKAGFIDGKVVTVDQIKTLATLPPKEVLLAQVLRGMNGPVSGLVTVLNGTLKGLVVALNAIAEKEQQQSA